jgi:hypothetical protein
MKGSSMALSLIACALLALAWFGGLALLISKINPRF